MLGLYIHIPFCKTICSYCDFPKRIAKNDEMIHNYIDKVISDLSMYKNYEKEINTTYIGGGTPNMLPLNELERLLKAIFDINDNFIEFSIELNPELVTEDLCKLLAKYHVNRVSLGVQTFNPNLIKLLNRHHTKEIVFSSIALLKNYGITNINIDLMNSVPFQTLDDIKEDLKIFYELKVPHISYYSFILEEKTKMFLDYQNKKIELTDEDMSAKMYTYIKHDLEKNGYIHYEISNFAKEGFESLHNEIYWKCDEYIGVGAAASGYTNSARYDNPKSVADYLKGVPKEVTNLTITDKKNEFMMLGLRMVKGVSLNEYHNRFNSSIYDDYKLDKYFKYNLLKEENGYIFLTEKGLLLGNLVFEEFVGD